MVDFFDWSNLCRLRSYPFYAEMNVAFKVVHAISSKTGGSGNNTPRRFVRLIDLLLVNEKLLGRLRGSRHHRRRGGRHRVPVVVGRTHEVRRVPFICWYSPRISTTEFCPGCSYGIRFMSCSRWWRLCCARSARSSASQSGCMCHSAALLLTAMNRHITCIRVIIFQSFYSSAGRARRSIEQYRSCLCGRCHKRDGISSLQGISSGCAPFASVLPGSVRCC